MKTHRIMLTATALLLVAGSAVPAQPTTTRQNQPPANQQQQGRQPAAQPGQTEVAATGYQLIPTEWAIDADLVNAQDEDLGTLDDLVLDFRAGRITHGVVSHGGVLGVGGKTIAVPWQSFRWNAEEEHFILQMTENQLEQAPEFDPNRLQQRGDRTDRGGIGAAPRTTPAGDEDGWGMDSEYQALVRGGQQTQAQGSVTNISREAPMQGMNDGIVITIAGDGEREQQVHLGPAWFIDRQDVMLRLGDEVRVQGVQADLDGQPVIIAHMLSGPYGEFRLRNEQGNPAWDASTSAGGRTGQPQQNQRQRPGNQQQRNGQQDDMQPRQQRPGAMLQPDRNAAPRQPDQRQPMNDRQPMNERQPMDQQARQQPSPQNSILVSELTGKNITTLGEEDLGEVGNIVFDSMSGKVAFVVLSGGDADDVGVPWDMFRVEPDGRLLATGLDQNKLEGAPTIDDWDQLRSPDSVGRIYQHFGRQNPFQQGGARLQPGVQQRPETARPDQPGRQPDRQQGPQDQQPNNQQQLQQRYTQLFTGGQQASVTGSINSTQQAAPMQGLPPILVLTIQDQQGQQQTVHLAPQQFLQQQNINLKQGDQVTIQGRQANLDGKQVIIATQIQKDGQSITLRDSSGQPQWQQQNQPQPSPR